MYRKRKGVTPLTLIIALVVIAGVTIAISRFSATEGPTEAIGEQLLSGGGGGRVKCPYSCKTPDRCVDSGGESVRGYSCGTLLAVCCKPKSTTVITYIPSSSTTIPPSGNSCSDSDGLVPTVRGTVSGFSGGNYYRYTDFCSGDQFTLTEYYCLYNSPRSMDLPCKSSTTNKCIEGACVK